MIKINDIYYNNYTIKVQWGNFVVTIGNKQTSGTAPFIIFNIKNNLSVGLETRFSKCFLKKLIVNEKTNVNEYLTDVLYMDGKGWSSLIGKYNFEITKMNNNKFKIEFDIDLKAIEKINISINTNVELI